ncbi:ArnT family glycosyltransferase [Halorientalis pallida]|uniref:Glycosyltransferase family 39 protein n=1 Tax=Halorientalis pallida TaxID=2479928 RepID=A0A498KW24_9EURY|nr:glycosyltransferase family 39 protein [Halorientalis pallida]RXK49005.1 glycosyltransferase family 39 protein [Halorientalis pallida]
MASGTTESRSRTWRVGVVALAAVAAIAIWVLATRLFPHHSLNHDEAVYLQQAAMLLDGRLFLSPPVEDVFRPWFFVQDGGQLYSKYAPVVPALFAVGQLLGTPRLALAGIAAANVALIGLIVRHLFDRRTGLLAALFVLASPLFLIDSAVFLPYAPTTMLNLTFLYAYLRAGKSGDRRWAGAAGAAVGLAFFARPYTAVLFAVPVIGHALWTLSRERRDALPRQILTAAFGLAGVALSLGYNAVVTGSPLVFPYQAFAPKDGLGFGYHEILGHDVEYTVGLALRSNAVVLEQLTTTWVAGGLFGTALAVGGIAVAVRRGLSARQGILAGQIGTIVVGNVYFWGNYNVLGVLERAGDGLIASHGPYYHFDLLLPFGAFAAVGTLALVGTVRELARERFAPGAVQAVVVGVVLVTAAVLGTATAAKVERPVEMNALATETYDRAYEPFEERSLDGGLVLLPTPYGDWLNHPFQSLRNDPDFDGETVYAMDERPFAVVDAHPDRRLYRYTFRGEWEPYDGAPRGAAIQPVDHAAGETVTLNATVGLPATYRTVSATLTADDESVTVVARDASNPATARVRFADGAARLVGPAWPSRDPIPYDDPAEVSLTLFVDSGPGASFSYRFETPVSREQGRIRALTPRVERCVAIGECGGEAGYVPGLSPDWASVRTNLTVGEDNR